MSHLERAWTALMADDAVGAARELQYTEKPAERALRGVAGALERIGAATAAAWMDAPNIRLRGRTPRAFLQFDDPETWFEVRRLFRVPIDVDAILRESGRGYP